MAGQGGAPVGDDLPVSDEDFSSGKTAVRIASVAALGGLLFGYDSAVINGAVDSIQEDFGIGNTELGIAVASALLGAAAGAMTAGRIADKIGRIAVMKIAAVLFLISAFGTGLAPDVLWVVIFRVVGGIGVGVASVIAPAYIAETSPPGIRGRARTAGGRSPTRSSGSPAPSTSSTPTTRAPRRCTSTSCATRRSWRRSGRGFRTSGPTSTALRACWPPAGTCAGGGGR